MKRTWILGMAAAAIALLVTWGMYGAGAEAQKAQGVSSNAGGCVPPGNKPYFIPGNNATRGQTSKIVANAFFPNCTTSIQK